MLGLSRAWFAHLMAVADLRLGGGCVHGLNMPDI
jgi:hypothetical protein